MVVWTFCLEREIYDSKTRVGNDLSTCRIRKTKQMGLERQGMWALLFLGQVVWGSTGFWEHSYWVPHLPSQTLIFNFGIPRTSQLLEATVTATDFWVISLCQTPYRALLPFSSIPTTLCSSGSLCNLSKVIKTICGGCKGSQQPDSKSYVLNPSNC